MKPTEPIIEEETTPTDYITDTDLGDMQTEIIHDEPIHTNDEIY